MTSQRPSYSVASTIRLNNDIQMPRIHLGVYMTSGSQTKNAVTHALSAGYRAIDSAEWYANEAEVGSSIRSYLDSDQNTTGLKREDIWFTTKLKENNGYDATRKSIKKSIKQSGLGYLDLYLLHSPYGGKKARLECWRAVEDAVQEGEVRAGGVSNFGVKHLQELLDAKTKLVPAVNQVEVHPFNTRTDITTFCASHGIVVEAYAPLARAMRMKHPTVVELSKRYACTPAQLLVRWSLQHGYVPLPKSVKRERIIANAEVDGFEIDEDGMGDLDRCDEYLVTDWDPTDCD
ncbi:aldo/keto reductase [Drepanopeziza brunnea f. sp. 'multigermtubi' MB_m1]|uniref:Aldo/keto reductase n=1 Tax=Marssonina brunnea f. sp. multigermtubi (strain MB_m1) TaxID=1072389 RepID=K1XPK9_MARBU|nr:aldo/keto reductase [Drepanopeziza brunnea f. sp. 'multigermtubi' MB_m1]EKD14459.1 aldo/keto reductase [Drepanopeziza brunnea f. sp. 'multigermtubi' MB_m1]